MFMTKIFILEQSRRTGWKVERRSHFCSSRREKNSDDFPRLSQAIAYLSIKLRSFARIVQIALVLHCSSCHITLILNHCTQESKTSTTPRETST
jgi:hypothetical protein